MTKRKGKKEKEGGREGGRGEGARGCECVERQRLPSDTLKNKEQHARGELRTASRAASRQVEGCGETHLEPAALPLPPSHTPGETSPARSLPDVVELLAADDAAAHALGHVLHEPVAVLAQVVGGVCGRARARGEGGKGERGVRRSSR